MKKITILLIALLAIAGSAFAQTSPTDTSATAAAVATYPAGTTYNAVPLSGLKIGAGSIIFADGSPAEGHLGISLMGPSVLGVQQIISVEAEVSGGSLTASNVVTLSGSCSIDMGNGTPAVTGIPFVATLTSDGTGMGSVGLVLGGTTLPAAALNDGSLTIAALTQ